MGRIKKTKRGILLILLILSKKSPPEGRQVHHSALYAPPIYLLKTCVDEWH
jgi:hypothetical protein